MNQNFKAKEFDFSKKPDNFTNYFIFNSSEQLRKELTSKYKIKLKDVFKGSTPIWKWQRV